MRRISWVCSMFVAAATACDSAGPNSFGNVQVSFATQGVEPPPLRAASPAVFGFRDDTITSGADTIILSSVEIVLREVELERVGGSDDCDDDDSDGDDDGSGDDCEELELGPFLISLPLDGSVSTQLAVDIPPASYSEIEFEVHKPDDDDDGDAEFLAEHPDFVDVSIRVQGTFNGQAFVYETDLNVEQELEFSPPLVIMDDEQTNVTIIVALDRWFEAPGGTLYDPATGNKGGANESAIKDNIIESFKAFEDDDRDGEEDDDDGDG